MVNLVDCISHWRNAIQHKKASAIKNAVKTVNKWKYRRSIGCEIYLHFVSKIRPTNSIVRRPIGQHTRETKRTQQRWMESKYLSRHEFDCHFTKLSRPIFNQNFQCNSFTVASCVNSFIRLLWSFGVINASYINVLVFLWYFLISSDFVLNLLMWESETEIYYSRNSSFRMVIFSYLAPNNQIFLITELRVNRTEHQDVDVKTPKSSQSRNLRNEKCRQNSNLRTINLWLHHTRHSKFGQNRHYSDRLWAKL